MSDKTVTGDPKSPLYFEDLVVGRRFETGSVVVERAAIKRFATEFDPQPFHLDERAAEDTFFGGLVASGWHTAALTMRLLVGGLPIAGGVIGAGGEVIWPKPVHPGDELRVVVEVVVAKRSASRPERGLVTVRSETLNHRGEAVQIMTAHLVVSCRPESRRTVK